MIEEEEKKKKNKKKKRKKEGGREDLGGSSPGQALELGKTKNGGEGGLGTGERSLFQWGDDRSVGPTGLVALLWPAGFK